MRRPPPPPGHWWATMARRGLWTLALLALIAVCDQAQAQNNAATGAPAVTAVDSADLTMVGPNESISLVAARGTIADADGITTFAPAWQWRQADAPASGAPADSAYTAIADATTAIFVPRQAQAGKFLRACATFDDDAGNSETLCWTSVAAVVDVNNAPTTGSNPVDVPSNATAASPYTFKESDFPFMDADGDTLFGIIVVSNPDSSKGTLLHAGAAIADGGSIPRSGLGQITYHPAVGASPKVNYDSFTFRVQDSSTDRLTSNLRTIIINLRNPNQVAATGTATITPAITADNPTHAEGTGLFASILQIRDDNGINASTTVYEWQQSASADGPFTAIAGATANAFTPEQAQVGMHIRVCISFMDSHSTPNAEGPFCSAASGVHNINDAPVVAENPPAYTARNMPGSADTVIIHPAAFQAAYMDEDPDDSLASVTITTLPPAADGILSFGGTPVTEDQTLTITNNEFADGPLTFTPTDRDTESTTLSFTVTDNGTPQLASDAETPATITINIQLGQDITEQQAVQISAILTAPAMANAANAIMAAMSASPTANAFALSLDGTSITDTARTLWQSTAPAGQTAWYHSTTAEYEYNAAYNANDSSAESLLHRLQSMAAGDIAMNYQQGGSAVRFWARYQSTDISGNEGEMLEYDGSGTGFYLGADRRINDKMRLGLAISSDSADITLDLDGDMMDDDATRSATTIYPYMQMAFGNNNHLRVIAGIGSGDLDIKSTANSNSTASASLSWNMLAASISHHRPMKGRLSARFDGSLQLGNSSTDATTFANDASLAAADASTNEIAVNAELRYQSNNFTPFASLSGRKLGGDLSQSLALDMAFGADLQTSPANLRLAITRQINDTTHQRHSISLDASTRPSASGISASLGSRYDSITGRPQWQSTVRWQHRAAELSLAASQSDCRLQARLLW